MTVFIETTDGMFLEGDLLECYSDEITIDERFMGVITIRRNEICDLYGDVMLEEKDSY